MFRCHREYTTEEWGMGIRKTREKKGKTIWLMVGDEKIQEKFVCMYIHSRHKLQWKKKRANKERRKTSIKKSIHIRNRLFFASFFLTFLFFTSTLCSRQSVPLSLPLFSVTINWFFRSSLVEKAWTSLTDAWIFSILSPLTSYLVDLVFSVGNICRYTFPLLSSFSFY